MIKKIATHKGLFHADEITAIALLEIFTDEKYQIDRFPHGWGDFDGYDFVIDIGREFDGKKFFDHHQWRGGKSSAGLIWDYLGVAKDYPKLSRFIEMVDRQDTGEQKAGEFEYPNLIKLFNTIDVSDDKSSNENFLKALEFAKMVIKSIKKEEDEIKEAKVIVEKSKKFDTFESIVELKQFTPFWNHFINGTLRPEVDVVVWQDKKSKAYKAGVPPKEAGSFELWGEPFKKDGMMEFVHPVGFFAVAKDKKTMKKYLKKHLKGERDVKTD
jgi:uncharacterized UPF0160 family protein